MTVWPGSTAINFYYIKAQLGIATELSAGKQSPWPRVVCVMVAYLYVRVSSIRSVCWLVNEQELQEVLLLSAQVCSLTSTGNETQNNAFKLCIDRD